MADRFKAVSPCRSCEKRGYRQTHTDRRGGARRAVWSVGHGGQRVSPQRFLPLGFVLNASLWQRGGWKRSDYSTDEVPREKKKTAPCRTCPLRRPPLPSGWHAQAPRPPSSVYCEPELQPRGRDKHRRHENDRPDMRARALHVLWTLVMQLRRESARQDQHSKLSHPFPHSAVT